MFYVIIEGGDIVVSQHSTRPAAEYEAVMRCKAREGRLHYQVLDANGNHPVMVFTTRPNACSKWTLGVILSVLAVAVLYGVLR